MMHPIRFFGFLVVVATLFACSSCGKKGVDVSSLKSAPSLILTANAESTESFESLDSKCIGWGSGKITQNQRPQVIVGYNEKYKDYNAVFIGEDNKKVYLTFDEGYENGYTSEILDTLKQKKVKAVFFVTYDYVKKNPDLVKRMIDEGHTVGNHSYSHPSMPSLCSQDAKQEVMQIHNYVKENFGYEMTLFRFPMGEFSEKSLAVCNSCGYKSVFWSFAYVDWKTDNQPDEKQAREKIVSSAHNGAIYLLHAVSQTNTNILSDVIDDVRAQGYEWAEFR